MLDWFTKNPIEQVIVESQPSRGEERRGAERQVAASPDWGKGWRMRAGAGVDPLLLTQAE